MNTNGIRAKTLGDAELQLLTYIADRPGVSVREAWEEFGIPREYVRTTVLQMMERMRKKGFLDRAAGAGGWRYSAVTTIPTVLRSAVDRFVTDALGGSVSPFVQYLADANNLTSEDLEALDALVARLKQDHLGPG